MALRAGGRLQILHGLRQSIHHANMLGLTTSSERLVALQEDVAARTEAELSQSKREQISLEVRRITDQIGTVAETAQPGFRSGMKWRA